MFVVSSSFVKLAPAGGVLSFSMAFFIEDPGVDTPEDVEESPILSTKSATAIEKGSSDRSDISLGSDFVKAYSFP